MKPFSPDPYERVGREYASASSNIGYAGNEMHKFKTHYPLNY